MSRLLLATFGLAPIIIYSGSVTDNMQFSLDVSLYNETVTSDRAIDTDLLTKFVKKKIVVIASIEATLY